MEGKIEHSAILVGLRGLINRCPNCGNGKLFKSYLKPVDACAECGEKLSHIRADDGPAWLTIIVVGHILAPILLAVVPNSDLPSYVFMIGLPLLALVIALLFLPRAKGIFVGVLWRMQFLAVIVVMFLGISGGDAFAMSAKPETAKDSFNRLNVCAKKEDTQGCTELFTASSSALYNRFVKHGLVSCLPKDAEFVSQKTDGEYQIIRASTVFRGKKRGMRLYFAQEEDIWKIDVPKSLQVSMGENWEKQVNAIEQIYLMMKAQMGDKLNCQMIQGLAGVK